MFLEYLFYFLWGAGHALQPGHGKAIISAYLLGASSGRKPGQAVFDSFLLGLITAATHTIVVFGLALVVYIVGQGTDTDRIEVYTSLFGAVLVIAVGVWMLRQRISGHTHSHGVVDHHGEAVEDNHDHDHHHGHSHSHALPKWAKDEDAEDGKRSWKRLLALGISGGIVPCKGALLIFSGASIFGDLAQPLLALSIYSLGILATMTGVGILAVFFSKTVERLSAKATESKQGFFGKLWLILWWGGPVVVLGAGAWLLIHWLSYL